MSYLVIARLRNAELRELANQITAPFNPVVSGNTYTIKTASMYEAYRVQDQLRSRDRHYKFRDHVWLYGVSVQLGEKQ
jgi:hypothetical protein